MLDAVFGFRLNPLMIGLGLLLAGVVVGYGGRSDRDGQFENEPTVLVEMVRPQSVVPPEVQLLADLEYARPNGQPLHLDLYRPEEITGPLPVVLWIHGGGWRSGSKASPPAMELVAKGYAVASVEYRLSDVALFPAQIEDCQAAVRWLRTHADEFQLDARRIAAWGESSGGHLATLLGTMSHGVTHDDEVSADVQAVVDFGGPVDFLTLDEQSSGENAVRHEEAWSPESLLVGGPIQERQELVALANPLTYLSTDRRPPPFLVVHSRHDTVVPIRQSDQLVQALRRVGTRVQYLRVREGWKINILKPEMLDAVAEFLERHLKNGSPATEEATAAVSERRPHPVRHWLRKAYRSSILNDARPMM
ncbi:MAG TPA: alpha/beta hydrolase [Planctomycetaceae bacterium]|nr:alpha/beta hydrolase [Planctomycetaceae bacterium]